MYKYIIGLIVCMLIAFNYGELRIQSKFDSYKREQAELILKQHNEHEAQIIKNKKEKEDEIRNINSRHASILSSLQQRTSREQAQTLPVVSAGARSTGQQLFREDAEFLIGEATKAMILRQSLIDCRKDLN